MTGRAESLRRGIIAYGHMLKNAYIPNHKKKKIRMSLKSMQRELTRLQKEEQLEEMRLKIAKKRSNISRLQNQNRGPSAYKRFERIILSDSPDYWGQMGKTSKKRGPFDVI